MAHVKDTKSNPEQTLIQTIQAELEFIGSQLRVDPAGESIPIFGKSFAYVFLKPRSCQIMTLFDGYSIDFWDNGVHLADGSTQNISDIAKAIHGWLHARFTLDELNNLSFISVPETSYAHEHGDEAEQAWVRYLKHIPVSIPPLKKFVLEASSRPKLRQLFPYISMKTFCLSRCTGYPYTDDLPVVIPTESGDYEVLTRNGEAFGPGNAKWAADTVEANLPENCGPAVIGTAEDFEGWTNTR